MHKYEQASENLRHEVDMVKMMGDEDQDFDHHYANHIVRRSLRRSGCRL